MLPKLNLDGTLKKRAAATAEESQRGGFSPRINATANNKAASSSSAGSTPPPSSPPVNAPPLSPSSSTSNLSTHSLAGPAIASPHISPHEASLVEDGIVGISDPEITAILAAKSRHNSLERSPTSERPSFGSSGTASEARVSGSHSPGKRRPAPLATLVEHQNARAELTLAAPATSTGASTTTVATEDAAANSNCTGSSATGTLSASRTVSRIGTTTASAVDASACAVTTVTTEEVYIGGKTFRDYMTGITARKAAGGGAAAAAALESNAPTAAAGAYISTTFHQNPAFYISAMASQGEFVAVGDRTGRVVVMRQRAMSDDARDTLLDSIEKSDETQEKSPGKGPANSTSDSSILFAPGPALNHAMEHYEFHVAQQAYVSVIDTLNSVEVTPNVTALAFLPQCSPTTFLLAANEKVPKLYKIMSVRESANPFRAVDKIGIKMIGPLTASSRTSTVAMKPVARYALSHEYSIHSICPIAFSDQFATADDATVLLWCTEYPDTSIETYDLRSPYDDGPREAIRCVRSFPHEPFLFFVTTSAGTVRVVDTRQALRWVDQSAIVFANPPREEDEPFSNVTNSICDCALSPSGRYIAGRDFMSVCLWDIRKAGAGLAGSPTRTPRRPAPMSYAGPNADCGLVRRWELYPSLRPDLENIYQSSLLFERFDVQFLAGNQVCTGGFNNTLYTMNVEGTSTEAEADIRTFQLPKTEGIAECRRTTVSAHRPAEDKTSTGQGLGSRITLMTRPTMSMGGGCGMVVACGQAVLQLSYDGRRR